MSIVGASVRAAAQSALRAGLTPWCIDLFNDRDLRLSAPCQRCPIDSYPQQLPEMLRAAPPGPVMYTGGLENHPRLIDEIARKHPLWGNPSDVLMRVRDPFFVAGLLAKNGLKRPEASRSPMGAPALKKPLKGAGGLNIRVAQVDDREADGAYFQEYISGPPHSVIYCCSRKGSELLGVTQQLIGERWLFAKPFQYAGNVGPVRLSANADKSLQLLGALLHTECGMRGLVGVDFILQDDHPWVVEINPRYTASVEVLEHATGLKSLDYHRAAFEPYEHLPVSKPAGSCIGKAILFAPCRLKFPLQGPWDQIRDSFTCPLFADIPGQGEIIEEGWPILTFFVKASTPEECRTTLQQRAREIARYLGISE